EELRAAVKVLPEDPEARHNLGAVLFKLNDFDGAISELSLAIRLNPLLSDARINLAQAYRKAGRMDEARRETEEVEKILKQKANAGRSLILTESAARRVTSGDLSGAIAELREAITLNPESIEAHFLLGQVSSDPLEILKTFRRVLELNPRHADAHYQLGIALEKQGKKSEAITEYSSAVELAPSHVDAHRSLGRAALALKDWETAAMQFRAVLAWIPNDPEAEEGLRKIRK
ncbi:MAG: tetratricopeptide repeat protein, partial [Acidobacteria bacterium]|nr:tetratricopeptide repeat protein [Acidobacteriota bacterium]